MKIKAVHDNDLVGVLKKLGVYEGIVNKMYSCIICGKKITLDNLGAIVRLDSVKFVCDDPTCLYKAAKLMKIIRS